MKLSELTKEKERLENILQSIGDGVITIDNQGIINRMNHGAEVITGRPAKQCIGKKLPEVFQVYNKKNGLPLAEWLKDVVQDQKATGLLKDTVLTTEDGSEKFISASISPIMVQNGSIGSVIVFRDINRIRQTERELENAVEQAKDANNAKSEFLANISHEIRTPLNGLMGMLELTLLTDITEEQRENLTIAQFCASTLMQLMNNILDLSRIEAGKMTLENIPFRFNNFMEITIKPFQVKAVKKGLAFHYTFDPNIPENLTGDPFKIRQVIGNLLSNAIKFTEKGEIHLHVSLVSISKVQQKVWLSFSVSDTGIGLEEKDKERIFESFTQADSSITRMYGGSGLGLAICKRLVQLMGGDIKVESRPGKGSVFSFTVILSYR